MIARLPVLATVIVAGAAATMVALGIWQLQRAEEKAALLAGYEAALASDAEVPFPLTEEGRRGALYRRATLACDTVLAAEATGAKNAAGVGGWAQVARCAIPGGDAQVLIGWMRAPQPVAWGGGPVTGTIAPAGNGVKLVADPPLAGLEPLAAPDPADIPDNHLAYAMQWFFFAITALVIYALALRRRLARGEGEG